AASTISSDSGTLNLTIAGTITGATFRLTLTGAGIGTISSIIGTTSGTLTKSGTGTWTLTGADTYTGSTSINAGILNIQNATALGTIAGATTISSSATLQLQGGITVGAEALTISGTGAAGQNGALVNVSATNNYGGLLVLGAASTISSDSGTLNLTHIGTITGATFGLTLTGAATGSISSIIGTTTGSLTKSGSGTWTLSGVNTYTGATTVNAGTLSVTGSLASGSAVTVNNSGSVLEGTGTIYGSVSIASSGAILEAGTGSTGQSWTYNFSYDAANGGEIDLTVTAAPEPSTYVAGALALAALMYNQRRRVLRMRRVVAGSWS